MKSKQEYINLYINNGLYFVLNAVKEIEFDQDIKLNGNLVCVAPIIRCRGEIISIDLSGKDGNQAS